MQVAGNESVIENNLFLHNDWTGHTPSNGATLYTQVHCYLQHHIHHPKQRLDNAPALFSQAFSTNDVVIHNTFISNGKEAGIRLGDRPRIQYNEIVGQCKGRIANDGAAVQVHSNQKKECTVHTKSWSVMLSNLVAGANESHGGGSRQSQLGSRFSKGRIPV